MNYPLDYIGVSVMNSDHGVLTDKAVVISIEFSPDGKKKVYEILIHEPSGVDQLIEQLMTAKQEAFPSEIGDPSSEQ